MTACAAQLTTAMNMVFLCMCREVGRLPFFWLGGRYCTRDRITRLLLACVETYCYQGPLGRILAQYYCTVLLRTAACMAHTTRGGERRSKPVDTGRAA